MLTIEKDSTLEIHSCFANRQKRFLDVAVGRGERRDGATTERSYFEIVRRFQNTEESVA